MVEKVYNMKQGEDKVIERVIGDENLHYMHMILPEGERLPEHYSNSNVYMTVIRGILSINLDEQGVHEYNKGTVLRIPNETKMDVRNLHSDVLELSVIKVPAPN